MMRTARSPLSPARKRTVTRDFILGLPSMWVSGVMANVRTVDSLPSTVRVTVTLVSLKTVMMPAKN